MEQKQLSHPGISQQSLLMLEHGESEHRNCFRTVERMELHQTPSQMGRAAVGAGTRAPAENCIHSCVGQAWSTAEGRRANAVFGHRISCQRVPGQFRLVHRCFLCDFVGLIMQKGGKHWGLWMSVV